MKRNDELGVLSNSLDEMTNELKKRIATAETVSYTHLTLPTSDLV